MFSIDSSCQDQGLLLLPDSSSNKDNLSPTSCSPKKHVQLVQTTRKMLAHRGLITFFAFTHIVIPYIQLPCLKPTQIHATLCCGALCNILINNYVRKLHLCKVKWPRKIFPFILCMTVAQIKKWLPRLMSSTHKVQLNKLSYVSSAISNFIVIVSVVNNHDSCIFMHELNWKTTRQHKYLK